MQTKTNPESAAVEAVAWIDMAKLSGHGMVYATPFKCSDRQSPLYPQSALDALRGEVAAERERADKFMWQVRDTCARAEKAERRVAELESALKGLLDDTQHKDHNCGDEEWCPVIHARAALTKESP